ncbi:MAG: peptidoglycan recognition family protein, partial [Candidatus Wallbacteria bacterium]|nr:peptidoglycan recognition family protein [Candidatus Wallbacteria bacterium]
MLYYLAGLFFLFGTADRCESAVTGLAAENPAFSGVADLVDYPGAVPAFSQVNHLKFRIHPIDTIVIHWVGEGTADSAVRWFKNPASRVSAHFVIDRSGRVSQVIKVRDTAWHCTRRTDPPGGMNNPRSI